MIKKSSKIVFFGNERLVSGLASTNTPVLRSLINEGYDVVAVVANHSDGKSRRSRSLEVADIAKKYKIPVFLPKNLSDIKDELSSMDGEAAILVAYGRIIPQGIIDIFPRGIINLHPSLLPKYRGPTPIESAIYNGDSETGVSIMLLTSGMDEGPVYAQTKIPINIEDTKFELYEKLSLAGSKLLIDSLPSILGGELKPMEQDNSLATYCSLLSKDDSLLKPESKSAAELECQVRAHLVYPKTRYKICNHDIIITKASVSRTPQNKTDISCKDGQYLVIEKLIAPSGREMDVQAFINGYC